MACTALTVLVGALIGLGTQRTSGCGFGTIGTYPLGGRDRTSVCERKDGASLELNTATLCVVPQTKLYVLKICSGEYSDYSENIVGITDRADYVIAWNELHVDNQYEEFELNQIDNFYMKNIMAYCNVQTNPMCVCGHTAWQHKTHTKTRKCKFHMLPHHSCLKFTLRT